jgi:hypothetical protein
MLESGYRRYLEETGKKELKRNFVKLSNSKAADGKLEELLQQQWTWFFLPHNCARFVEVVVQAGGSNAGLYSNCPTLETFR